MHVAPEQYAALTRGAGLVDVSDRTQIEVCGDDRAKFLHNMCTQEVKKLPVGEGAEAFFTDAKGHVLAFADLFVAPHSIVIDTVPMQAAALVAHLDKYIIRDDVRLVDKSDTWGELLVAGDRVEAMLAKLCAGALHDQLWRHAASRIGGCDVFVRRVALAGPESWTIVCKKSELEEIQSALLVAGFVSCRSDVLEAVRIENRVPQYGRDITDRNLPQEVDRNATAIRFDKGCYIGQETVARLDALGHVNKLLVRVKFDGKDIPPSGTPLDAGGHAVGAVTSSTYSPRYNAPLALAYVRREQSKPGTRLASALGNGEVI
jgi:folate-binding protein YgfZ